MADVREFSIKLLELVDAGYFDARQVLGNLVYNFLSEETVKDFCESEYEEAFETEEDEDEQDEQED